MSLNLHNIQAGTAVYGVPSGGPTENSTLIQLGVMTCDYYKNVEQVVGPDHKGEHVFFHLDKQEALPDIISEEVTMMQVAAQVVMNRMGMTILITIMRVPIHMHTTMH